MGFGRFKPHQRGGGCCSSVYALGHLAGIFVFQTPSAGRWVLQQVEGSFLRVLGFRFKPHQRGGGCCSQHLCQDDCPSPQVSNPISGEVGAAASTGAIARTVLKSCFKPHQRGGGCCSSAKTLFMAVTVGLFQTPSAGRWVLQRGNDAQDVSLHVVVSNPISGEVGAAAFLGLTGRDSAVASFKPHQRGGGCCSDTAFLLIVIASLFQTPSAGRWVLQRPTPSGSSSAASSGFKPHQRGGGCCSRRLRLGPSGLELHVSNPISGEVGAAAAPVLLAVFCRELAFQTPSAGRWVLQQLAFWSSSSAWLTFQTPSAGRWVLQHLFTEMSRCPSKFQTPSAGRWVLQLVHSPNADGTPHSCFKPHQRGGGCCSRWRI